MSERANIIIENVHIHLPERSGRPCVKAKPVSRPEPDLKPSGMSDEEWEILNGTIHRNIQDGKYAVGDTLTRTMPDGTKIIWDVIGVDVDELVNPEYPHSITIQMHDLVLPKMPFDSDTNVWEKSEIRRNLNSGMFDFKAMGFDSLAVPVYKNTDGVITADRYFLLSKDEVDEDETPYPYYNDPDNRVKYTLNGEAQYVRLRSAYRGNALYAWFASNAGSVHYYTASYAYRCAPACVLQ